MKRWETNHSGISIVVVNRSFSEKLFVDGELQDEQVGGIVGRSRLWGRLPTGETVKVSVGQVFKIHCRIFINDQLIYSE
ncbi:MAG: hypothetical protein HGA49_11815 [Eubacteriaceae bacterium]|nr:hypothetical protein [Eubacteriaceae bacterium]